MASENLSPSLLKAGEEYLAALRRLNLDPDGLLWARENEISFLKNEGSDQFEQSNSPGEWHLVIITGVIAISGPLALNKLLFKAYNSSATPQEISPFIVEVVDVNSGFARELNQSLRGADDWMSAFSMIGFAGPSGEVANISHLGEETMVDGLWFNKKWIYFLKDYMPEKHVQQKTWSDFRKSVTALAA